VESNLKIASSAPRVHVARSLSKDAFWGLFCLGFVAVFFLVAFGGEGGVLQDMGITVGSMILLLRDGICSHLLVGNTNSESLLKMHKRHIKRCSKLVFV